jgi:8-oxo-dGTP pyrophosphatase MutT (NUDIX family)
VPDAHPPWEFGTRLARIARTLASRPAVLAERDEPYKEAAVAVVLRPGAVGDDLELLLIRRAEREGDPWSGQIGLPGGRWDTTDTSLEHTAVRETHEELGLDLRTHGRVLGMLDELRPRTPVLPPIIVRPYVVAIDGAPPFTLSDEVAAYRWVRLGELFRPDARMTTTVQVRSYAMRVEALHIGDFTIWGMTERILTTLHEVWR